MSKRRAIIAGGGIAGLSTALALLQAGWHVTVLERAPKLAEVGAGLQVSPNGMKVLQRLEIAPAIERTLFEPEAIEIRRGKSGRPLMHLPLREEAQWRWNQSYIHIHRHDLVDAFASRLARRSPETVRCGKTVARFQQDESGVHVTCEDGETFTADLLVGADGIHSATRTAMFGADNPHFTGNVAWRAVIPVERFGDNPPPPTACIWTGHRHHAVTTRLRGGSLVNFVGMVERSEPSHESWESEGSREQARSDFAGWATPVMRAIEEADTLNLWPLYDRPPLPRWSQGRVVLVGDAAHPMLPSLAQGAVQALEDAVCLADTLGEFDQIERAAATFFDRRIKRATKVQQESAANVRRFHRDGTLPGFVQAAAVALGGRLAPGLIQRRNNWLFGFDPNQWKAQES